MLLELIAVILIVLGVFLVFRGLTETYESPYELEHEFEEITEPKFEPEFEEDWKKKKKKKTEVKAGGVILIGPIPIVFGESRFAVYALILTIILMLMAFLLMLVPYWRW